MTAVGWSGVGKMGLLPAGMNTAVLKTLMGIAGLAVFVAAIALLIL
ncbi:MAG: hypothetical protein IH868_07440 [Chloroflexi bacterium]|nr:hypothetical protein [Chloroflexota bacterium]